MPKVKIPTRRKVYRVTKFVATSPSPRSPAKRVFRPKIRRNVKYRLKRAPRSSFCSGRRSKSSIELTSSTELTSQSKQSSRKVVKKSIATNLVPNCPSGLESLSLLEQLTIIQQFDNLPVFTGWEGRKRYAIKNAGHANVYYAVLCSVALTHPLDILLMDNDGRPVMHIRHPYDSMGDSLCGTLPRTDVISGDGLILGSIDEIWDLCSRKLAINDASNSEVFTLEGPACTRDIFDITFELITKGGSRVGSVSRQIGGFTTVQHISVDLLGVTFPFDLAVSLKAVLLASAFVIDYLFTERRRQQQQQQQYSNQYGNEVTFINTATTTDASK